ncbi:phage tail tape measure protein [Salmonella enterica subsp. enterica]|nr:phage tail tape measure protein [Salmonella enterica subsp. enterica]
MAIEALPTTAPLKAGERLAGLNHVAELRARFWGDTVFTVAGSAIVTALGAITWPIVAVGAAIVAGALLIRKYWEPISAFSRGSLRAS